MSDKLDEYRGGIEQCTQQLLVIAYRRGLGGKTRHVKVQYASGGEQSWRAAKTPGVRAWEEAKAVLSMEARVFTRCNRDARSRKDEVPWSCSEDSNYLAMDRSDLQFAAKELSS